MSKKIDWQALTCRHGDKNLVVALCHIPEGCWCWPDPVQALCLQHLHKAQSTGPIRLIATCLEDESAGANLRAEPAIVTDSQKALVLAIDEAREQHEPLIRLDREWAENLVRQFTEARNRNAALEAQLAEARAEAEHWRKCWEAKCAESAHQYEEAAELREKYEARMAELSLATVQLAELRAALERIAWGAPSSHEQRNTEIAAAAEFMRTHAAYARPYVIARAALARAPAAGRDEP